MTSYDEDDVICRAPYWPRRERFTATLIPLPIGNKPMERVYTRDTFGKKFAGEIQRMISTSTGSWNRLRRRNDRIQLPVDVEIIR